MHSNRRIRDWNVFLMALSIITPAAGMFLFLQRFPLTDPHASNGRWVGFIWLLTGTVIYSIQFIKIIINHPRSKNLQMQLGWWDNSRIKQLSIIGIFSYYYLSILWGPLILIYTIIVESFIKTDRK
jgi:hypothetical protein